MAKKRKKLIWIILALLVLAFLAKGFFIKEDNSLKVSTEKASPRTIVQTVRAPGKVYPEVEVKISPDISGQITELNVEEGDTVHKGQVLAKIYADVYALQRDEAASRVSQSAATVSNSQAALEATKASLEQAQINYDRNKQLFDEKVISKSELETFEIALRTAKANYNAALQNIKSLQANVQSSQVGLSKANTDLSRTTIVAPMDGVISSLRVKKGESVAGNSFNVGTEMMTIADLSGIEIRANVGENDIVRVNIGDSADVEIDAYNNRKFKGVVTKISSSTISATGSLTATNDVTEYEVRIRLDKDSYQDLIGKNFPFRPGMNANAEIKTKRLENVVSVPIVSVNARRKGTDEKVKETAPTPEEATVVYDEMEEVVFVLQSDNTVKKIIVKSGIQDDNYIQIIEGLKGGEEIITGPYGAISETLKEGSKVKVVPRSELFKK